MLSTIFRWLKSYFYAVHYLFILKKIHKLCNFFKTSHFFFFVYSQNQRLVEVGRDLWKSCPSPLLQPSHLGLVGQNNVHPDGFGSPRKDTLSPWATCCSSQSASQYKYVLVLRWSLTVPVCAHSLLSCPVLGITDRSLAPSSLLPHFRWWEVLMRVSLSFLLAEQSLLPHPFLVRDVAVPASLCDLCWTPSSVCVSHWALGCPDLGTAPVWVKGRLASVTCWCSLCHQPGLGHTAGSRMYQWMGLFSTAHFPILQRSLWMAAGPTGVSATPRFVSPAACQEHALPIVVNQDLFGECQRDLTEVSCCSPFSSWQSLHCRGLLKPDFPLLNPCWLLLVNH